MPKQRAAGAAKPYRYWHTYKVVGEDGKTVTRRSQRWMVRLDLGYDSSGRRIRRTITGKTSEAVKEKLREARSELAETGTVDRGKVKLGDYAHQWLERKSREADPKTIEMYRTVIDRHLDRYAGLPLAKIVPSTVRRILEEAQAYDQKGSPKGPAGVSLKRQIRTCLNQVMQAAWADRLIPSNPVLAVKTPSRKDQGEGRSAFSMPELRSMLDVSSRMPVEEGTIWWWRLLTGMRQGGDTRRDLGQPQHAHRRVHGGLEAPDRDQGPRLRRTGPWRVPVRQEEARPVPGRAVAHPGRVRHAPPVRLLRTHPAQVAHRQDRAHRAAAHGGHAPLPEGHQGHPQPVRAHLRREDGMPISKKKDTEAFASLMRAAGIDPSKHTGHETRYSAVTLLASQGVDLQLIQEIVGHSSEAMTMHYRTAGLEERKQAMLKLDSALGID